MQELVIVTNDRARRVSPKNSFRFKSLFMKSSTFLAAVLLSMGVSTAAFAQTKPASNAPADNNTNPMAPSNNQARVGTAVDGSNIANNRDRLSSGTGTQMAPARTPAERQAHKEAKAAKRAAKGKMK
jgi:hypothetical protein